MNRPCIGISTRSITRAIWTTAAINVLEPYQYANHTGMPRGRHSVLGIGRDESGGIRLAGAQSVCNKVNDDIYIFHPWMDGTGPKCCTDSRKVVQCRDKMLSTSNGSTVIGATSCWPPVFANSESRIQYPFWLWKRATLQCGFQLGHLAQLLTFDAFFFAAKLERTHCCRCSSLSPIGTGYFSRNRSIGESLGRLNDLMLLEFAFSLLSARNRKSSNILCQQESVQHSLLFFSLLSAPGELHFWKFFDLPSCTVQYLRVIVSITHPLFNVLAIKVKLTLTFT